MPRQPRKQLEEIVGEIGQYSIDAFVFVQECISVASERVHGPMTPAQASVARWMAQTEIDLEELRHLHEAGDLPLPIANALDEAGGTEQMNRHVTGQQLCWTIRDVALERWGAMAPIVLKRWKITRTEDIGIIIFSLVDNDWLQKQPTDQIEDFENVFSFDDAFGPNRRAGNK